MRGPHLALTFSVFPSPNPRPLDEKSTRKYRSINAGIHTCWRLSSNLNFKLVHRSLLGTGMVDMFLVWRLSRPGNHGVHRVKKHNMNRHRGLGGIIWGVSKIKYSMCLRYLFWDLSLNSKELPRTQKWTHSPLQIKLASLTKSGARAKQNSFKINDPRRGSNCLICGAPVLRFWGWYGGLDDQVRPLFQSLRHFDSIRPLRPFIVTL